MHSIRRADFARQVSRGARILDTERLTRKVKERRGRQGAHFTSETVLAWHRQLVIDKVSYGQE